MLGRQDQVSWRDKVAGARRTSDNWGVRAAILGCGYVGLAVGRLLVREGVEVVGVRRSVDGCKEVEEMGMGFAVADVTQPRTLGSLPGPFDWVVNTVSSSRGGIDEYRAAFLWGNHNVIAWARTQPLKKLVYTSSTSVYGQTDGGWVDEASLADPASEAGRVLLQAEAVVLDAARSGGVPGVVLRLAGIYGRERGHLFHQFLAGSARIEGDGRRWLNMIHRDDAASAIAAALRRAPSGEVFNVSDDEPTTQGDFLIGVATRLGRRPPEGGVPDLTRRKRPATNKRVSNRKTRDALGWRPVFPSWREGYADAFADALSGEVMKGQLEQTAALASLSPGR